MNRIEQREIPKNIQFSALLLFDDSRRRHLLKNGSNTLCSRSITNCSRDIQDLQPGESLYSDVR